MSEYENETGLKLEVTPDLPTPHDLHNRFIPRDLIPPGQPSSESDAIELTIDDDYTMHLGEHEIVLGGLEIYILNSLLLLRGRQSTASELRSLGFTTTSSSPAAIRRAFSDAYENLVEQLNVNSNQPLVAAEGDEPESAHYHLNPNLVVTDKRTNEARVAPTPPIQPKRETASFVLQQGLRTERKPFRDEGDLYARLITPDRIPVVPLREGAIPIEIEVVDNTTLRIGGQTVRLGSHQRYLFNALMLHRDQVNAAGDLKEFGFYPGTKDATSNQAFFKGINRLLEQLNETAGIEIIKKMGQSRGTRYIVNPNLLLSDIRTDEDLARAIEEMRSSGSSAEKRELKDEGDLYQRLIDVERIPVIAVGEDGAIEVSVLDNTSLKVGTHTIRLDKHERYLFNALMLLREFPATGAELRQFGFFPDAQGNYAYVVFSKALASLEEKLSGVLGVEIIKRIGKGRGTSYAVNPNLVLADLRSEDDKEETVVDVQKKRGRPRKYPELDEAYGQPGKKSTYRGPSYEGDDDEIEHDADIERRVLLITEMVQQFSNHPLVTQALGRIKNGNQVRIPLDQPVNRYLQEIGQYDLLDPADEVRLFKILERGVNLYREQGIILGNEQAIIDAVIARQIVYVSNLRLVIEHAKKKAWYGRGMTMMDYIQEGNMGLADAIDRFDQSRGFKFSTYATWWVRMRIGRSEADKNHLIRIPVHLHDRLVKYSVTVQNLTKELDREPNLWEIAYKLEEPVAEVIKMQHISQLQPDSLNALLEESNRGTPGRQRLDQVQDPKANDEFEEVTQDAEDNAVIEDLFSKRNLTLQEKYVLSFRLGFVVESLRGTVLEYTDGTLLPYDDIVEHMADPEAGKFTHREAAPLFGVTGQRIQQIEKKALDKIRLNYHRR